MVKQVIPRKQTIGGIDKWEVQSAVDTLKNAESIKQDAKMMKAVKIEARREQKALRKIAREK